MPLHGTRWCALLAVHEALPGYSRGAHKRSLSVERNVIWSSNFRAEQVSTYTRASCTRWHDGASKGKTYRIWVGWGKASSSHHDVLRARRICSSSDASGRARVCKGAWNFRSEPGRVTSLTRNCSRGDTRVHLHAHFLFSQTFNEECRHVFRTCSRPIIVWRLTTAIVKAYSCMRRIGRVHEHVRDPTAYKLCVADGVSCTP